MTVEAFVIRIGRAPDEPDATEMLELVLAGASIDVDLVVVFEGAGMGHLQLPWARGWQQLTDFGLARLCALSPPRGGQASDLDAETILADEYAGLLSDRVPIVL